MAKKKIRLGTRGSQLALCQSGMIATQLRSLGSDVELIVIKTSGDFNTGPLAKIGGEGVFTKRLQSAVLDDEIDLAVHSLKDLPTDPVDGLTIAAVPEREDPRDALVLGKRCGRVVRSIDELKRGARIGTGSIRRKSQLLHLRIDLDIQDIRGNVDTRLSQVDLGDFDALVLACAGLNRLGLSDRISFPFPESELAPAVGQGALGLEVRANDRDTIKAIQVLNDKNSFAQVVAERTMLNRLSAGCMSPVGVVSSCDGDQLQLQGVVLNSAGTERITAESIGNLDDATGVGVETAQRLLSSGARRLLP